MRRSPLAFLLALRLAVVVDMRLAVDVHLDAGQLGACEGNAVEAEEDQPGPIRPCDALGVAVDLRALAAVERASALIDEGVQLRVVVAGEVPRLAGDLPPELPLEVLVGVGRRASPA